MKIKELFQLRIFHRKRHILLPLDIKFPLFTYVLCSFDPRYYDGEDVVGNIIQEVMKWWKKEEKVRIIKRLCSSQGEKEVNNQSWANESEYSYWNKVQFIPDFSSFFPRVLVASISDRSRDLVLLFYGENKTHTLLHALFTEVCWW